MESKHITLQAKFKEFKGTIGIMKEAGAEFNKELIDAAYKKFAFKHLDSIMIEKPRHYVSALERSLYICLQPNLYSEEAVDQAFEFLASVKGSIPEKMLEKVCANTGSSPQRMLEILDELVKPPLVEIASIDTSAGTIKCLAREGEFPQIMLGEKEMPVRMVKSMETAEVEALVRVLSEYIGGDIIERRQLLERNHKKLMVEIKDYDHKILDRHFPKQERKITKLVEEQKPVVVVRKREERAYVPEERREPEVQQAEQPELPVITDYINAAFNNDAAAFRAFASENHIRLNTISAVSQAISLFKRETGVQIDEDINRIMISSYAFEVPGRIVTQLQEELGATRDQVELTVIFLVKGLRLFTKKPAVGGVYFELVLAEKNVRSFISGEEYSDEDSARLTRAFAEFDPANLLHKNNAVIKHKGGNCVALSIDTRNYKSPALSELVEIILARSFRINATG